MRGINTDHYIEPENASPSTVFGLAAYNAAHLAEALESLLAQTRGDLAIVVTDDCPTDAVAEICRRYADLDPRISYEPNPRQLGLTLNWRRAFELAGERHPGARYFAWASDHDVWDPRWLELLSTELDGHPEAVFAYPFTTRIDDDGSEYPPRERLFDTAGVEDPRERLRRTSSQLRGAGALVYGLMRRSALERCGPYPLVLLPDRLLFACLALEGEFRQVRQHLWYRRFRAGKVMSNALQRREVYPDGAPLSSYVPWWLTHPVLLARSTGSPALGALLLRESLRSAVARKQERVRRDLRWRKRRTLERLGLRQRPALSGSTQMWQVELGKDVLEVGELSPGEGERLHAQGVEWIYTFGPESAALREELGRYYWLRRVWVDSGGRKPDPLTGPVPTPEGEPRLLVGRRRLLPD